MYFLARGYYPLPSTIQSLTLCSCFEKASLMRYSRTGAQHFSRPHNYLDGRKEEELCTKAALKELSQRYGSLSLLRHKDIAERGRDKLYSKTLDSLGGGPIWAVTSDWERALY